MNLMITILLAAAIMAVLVGIHVMERKTPVHRHALGLRMFDNYGGGTNVAALGGYTNAYTGAVTEYSQANGTMTPTLKQFYDTELLENARDKLIFAQLGRRQPLPAHTGTTVEWRKFNTLPMFSQLVDSVIPEGTKLGMTSINVSIAEYGEFVPVSERLKTHALDDIIVNATEELGAAGGLTMDILVRKVLETGTNVVFADAYTAAGAYDSTPATEDALQTAIAAGKICNLTPDMINKARTNLVVGKAPTMQGNDYVAVVHPYAVYDLRSHPDWEKAHEYAQPEEIYNGEIGRLHGVRFVESNLAPIIKKTGQANATFKTMVFGKDAFGVIDPEDGGMETIVKGPEHGGPLNQFSTVGAKFETAAKILYQERMVTIWHGSSYSGTATAN